MGDILRWRELPEDRDNKSYGTIVEFGGGLSRGTGYMAHADRVGPAVLVVHDRFGVHHRLKRFADALNEDGFTVLVPDLYEGTAADDPAAAEELWRSLDADLTGRRLQDAADHLTENWHPRLGIVGCGTGARLARDLCLSRSADAVVLFEQTRPDAVPEELAVPILVLEPDDDDSYDVSVEFLRRYLS